MSKRENFSEFCNWVGGGGGCKRLCQKTLRHLGNAPVFKESPPFHICTRGVFYPLSFSFFQYIFRFFNFFLSAAAFNASIDSEIQPCDDFYAYACGKIIREATFPDGWDTLNNVNAVVRKMTYRLIGIAILPIETKI